MRLLLQIALPLAVFAAVTGLALALGADGLGPAATWGELAFAGALVAVLVRLSPGRPR